MDRAFVKILFGIPTSREKSQEAGLSGIMYTFLYLERKRERVILLIVHRAISLFLLSYR